MALVISIIVLIILAGITINTLINNGITDKAKTATQEYKNAQNHEEIQIAKYTNDINSYIDSNREISNNIFIKDDGSEFETNEKLNGKTIFAKYFQATISSNGWDDVEHNISNVDTIWIDIGNSYALSDRDDFKYVLPTVTGCKYRVNSKYVGTYAESWNGSTIYLLLKYTKK